MQQRAAGEWTGPNGAVFKEDLPAGPLPPKEGKGRKRGTLIPVLAR